ncbi:MAG: hypothetical protein HYU64_06035 [Armatimonadetes bacterium]|nr:hypothetical protein [Armatimonadota bacterium]
MNMGRKENLSALLLLLCLSIQALVAGSGPLSTDQPIHFGGTITLPLLKMTTQFESWALGDNWRSDTTIQDSYLGKLLFTTIKYGNFVYFYVPRERQAMKTHVSKFIKPDDKSTAKSPKDLMDLIQNKTMVRKTGTRSLRGRLCDIYFINGSDGRNWIKGNVWVAKDRDVPIRSEFQTDSGPVITDYSFYERGSPLPPGIFSLPQGTRITDKMPELTAPGSGGTQHLDEILRKLGK